MIRFFPVSYRERPIEVAYCSLGRVKNGIGMIINAHGFLFGQLINAREV
jgi:hypothetical protein